MLHQTTNGLDQEPHDLDQRENAGESVGFIPVPDGSSFYFGVFNVVMFYQVNELMTVHGECRKSGTFEVDASHIGEKCMTHRPR